MTRKSCTSILGLEVDFRDVSRAYGLGPVKLMESSAWGL